MAERLLRPGARVIADNVLHPGAPLFVNDVKERYDLEVRPRVVLIVNAVYIGVVLKHYNKALFHQSVSWNVLRVLNVDPRWPKGLCI